MSWRQSCREDYPRSSTIRRFISGFSLPGPPCPHVRRSAIICVGSLVKQSGCCWLLCFFLSAVSAARVHTPPERARVPHASFQFFSSCFIVTRMLLSRSCLFPRPPSYPTFGVGHSRYVWKPVGCVCVCVCACACAREHTPSFPGTCPQCPLLHAESAPKAFSSPPSPPCFPVPWAGELLLLRSCGVGLVQVF